MLCETLLVHVRRVLPMSGTRLTAGRSDDAFCLVMECCQHTRSQIACVWPCHTAACDRLRGPSPSAQRQAGSYVVFRLNQMGRGRKKAVSGPDPPCTFNGGPSTAYIIMHTPL